MTGERCAQVPLVIADKRLKDAVLLEPEVERIYPLFWHYERVVKGYSTCPDLTEVREWYKFLEWCVAGLVSGSLTWRVPEKEGGKIEEKRIKTKKEKKHVTT